MGVFKLKGGIMMKFKLLIILIVIFNLMLVSCAPQNQEVASSAQQQFNIPFEYGKFYKETESESGFSNLIEPDLYNSYWIINLMDTFHYTPTNKNEIKKWIEQFNIEEKLDTIKDSQDEKAELFITYLSLKKKMDIPFKAKDKDLANNIIMNTSKEVDLSDKKIQINFSKIKIYTLLGLEIDNKEEITKNLNLCIENDQENKLYYIYLLSLLGEKVDVSSFNNINLINENNSKLNVFAINKLYYLKEISKFYKIEFQQNINKDALKEIIDNYISGNKEDTTVQILFKVLFVFQKQVGKEDIQRLFKYFEGIKSYNGWNKPNQTIDLVSTSYGLEIAEHYKVKNKLNINGINNYLQNAFKKINTNFDTNLFYLKFYINSILITQDEKKIQETKDLVNSKFKEMLNSKEKNYIYLIELMNCSILLNTHETLNKQITDQQHTEILEFVNKQLENTSNLYVLYNQSIYNKFTGINDENIYDKVITHFQEDGGFAIELNNPSTVEGTLTAVATLKYSNYTFNKSQKEKISTYLKEKSNVIDKNDFLSIGQITLISDLIK